MLVMIVVNVLYVSEVTYFCVGGESKCCHILDWSDSGVLIISLPYAV